MSKQQFQINYNGHRVAVTSAGNDTYVVQVSYKPLYVQLKRDDGHERWVNVEDGLETNVTAEVGRQIKAHVGVAEQV